ncbi:MAG: hypothetical protein QF819_07365 [Gemmatimonadota bacterium]|nr:hypothetical protein [Gemmatimonadota bacterium]MDP6802978.1 hypothetical protein [Gemmatimonadota bacterium]
MRKDAVAEKTAGASPGAGCRWESCFGTAWVDAVGRLGRRARGAGFALEAGSSDLLSWPLPEVAPGTSGAASGGARRLPHGGLTLRVPPGRTRCVEAWLEADPDLSPDAGNPWIRVEESCLALLPPLESLLERSSVWPNPEAWIRASVLLSPDARPSVDVVPGRREDLLERASSGKATQGPLEVRDRWRAALAWQLDRPAWWMARETRGFASPEEASRWVLKGRSWGVNVRRPCVLHSSLLAVPEGRALRPGLAPFVGRMAAGQIVLDRERGGEYTSLKNFLSRARALPLEGSALRTLERSGALNGLDDIERRRRFRVEWETRVGGPVSRVRKALLSGVGWGARVLGGAGTAGWPHRSVRNPGRGGSELGLNGGSW